VDYSTKPTIINFPELNNRILSGFENVYPVDANNIFVGSVNGFYHIQLRQIQTKYTGVESIYPKG
jgi:hypothetical protein